MMQPAARIDALARSLRHHDPSQLWYQLAEIIGERVYLRHGVTLRKGDVVLDVGANVGVAAVFFASDCQAGLVHSFEPVPPIFELLRDNVRPLPVCVAHNVGLSHTEGPASITYYPGATAMSGLYADPEQDRALVRACLLNRGLSAAEADGSLEGRYRAVTLPCQLRRLSSILREQMLDQVDLLKIDVEKAELDVLQGLDERDWSHIKQVVVEVHDEHDRCSRIATLLTNHGFLVTKDQDATMRGTAIHLLYGLRR
jgi:FkbM family methyltransferase